MALPVGYCGGKPVYGPPRPLLQNDTEISVPIPEDMRQPNGPPTESFKPKRVFQIRDDSLPVVKVEDVESECGLFGRLPREIRDQIYELLMVHRQIHDKASVQEYEQMLHMSRHQPIGDAHTGNERGVHLSKAGAKPCIIIGADRNSFGRKIFKTGLLLTNKQIYSEVTQVFFTHNTFAFLISPRTPGICKRCCNSNCRVCSSMCFPSQRQFAQIRHLHIWIDDQEFIGQVDANGVAEKAEYLHQFFRSQVTSLVNGLILCDVRLMSLHIVYQSSFRGELSDIVNSRSRATPSKPDFTVVHPLGEGTPYMIERRFDGTVIERETFVAGGLCVLSRLFCPFEAIIHLRGQVQDLQVSGDMPKDYMRLLMQNVLSPNYDDPQNLAAHVKRNLKLERTQRPKRGELRKVNRYLEDRGFPAVMLSASVLHAIKKVPTDALEEFLDWLMRP